MLQLCVPMLQPRVPMLQHRAAALCSPGAHLRELLAVVGRAVVGKHTLAEECDLQGMHVLERGIGSAAEDSACNALRTAVCTIHVRL